MSEQIVTPGKQYPGSSNNENKNQPAGSNRQQMREFFKNLGEKPFRADQVMKWMYRRLLR